MASKDNDLPGPEDIQREEEYLDNLVDSVRKRKSIVIHRPPKHLQEKQRQDEQQPPAAAKPAPPPLIPPPPSARVRAQQQAAPEAAAPVSAPRPAPGGPAPVLSDGTYPIGSILVFEDKSIAIFKDAKPDKDYEVVYLLRGDGSIKAQGVALQIYEVRKIGQLPRDIMESMGARGTWERDEIIFHLDAVEHCRLVPQPDTTQYDPMATSRLSGAFRKVIDEKKKEGKDLVRGRRLNISFGKGQSWEAVYWGEDELGHVVAHHTHEKWALMHLDLKRFKDTLVWGEMVGDDAVAEIHRDVA